MKENNNLVLLVITGIIVVVLLIFVIRRNRKDLTEMNPDTTESADEVQGDQQRRKDEL